MFHDVRPDAAAALNQGNHCRLVLHVSTAFAARLAAHVGFVGLHSAFEQIARVGVLERIADAMAEEPGGAIGADLKLALKL